MSESASGEAESSTSGSDKDFTCRTCGEEFKNNSNLYHHYRNHRNDCSGYGCPTCEKDHFTGEAGVKHHHAVEHNESLRLVTVSCENCGESVKKEPHHVENTDNQYCSKECQADYLRESITVECENCGEKYTQSPPSKAGRFCSKECATMYLRGERHPSYRNSPDSYGDRWFPQRRKARERDDYECRVCGKDKSDIGIHPHVHHIVPVRDFEDPNDAHDLDNLITLCPKHHAMYEGTYIAPQID